MTSSRALAASLIFAFTPAVASAQSSADPFDGPAAVRTPAPPARPLPPPETLDAPARRLPPPETIDGEAPRLAPAAPELVRPRRLELELPEAPRHRGWALGAGIYGFIASGFVLALGIASEATRTDGYTGAAFGVFDTIYLTISAPVVEAGAASARRATGAPGLLGARVTGWLTYALSLLDSMVIAVYTNIDGQRPPPAGLITSAGLLGTVSMLCMAADAVASHGQASRMQERAAIRPPRVAVAPTFRVSGTSATVGVAATF